MFRVFAAGAWLVLLQQAPPQPTFRSATELVEVDVRVVDKDGHFVATLAPDDFELTEDGVARPIDVVYLVAGDGARVISGRAAALETAGVASVASAARQTWIFVFDTTHLSPAGLKRTRDAVRQFVKGRFRDGDLGGIVGDRGMVNNRLTSNREELERAAASVSAHAGRRNVLAEMREWPRLRDEVETLQIARDDRQILKVVVVRACNDDPEFCSRRGAQERLELMLMEKARNIEREIRTATLQTIKMLLALTRGLARVTGPKTVVLLSEGFLTEGMESEIQGVAAQAAVAGARLYTIDARGLARGGIAEIMDARLADSTIGSLGGGRDMYSDGMNSLGVDTGGFAIRNENNFGRALDLVERDSGTYYVLGYRPASATYDGKYHRIQVRVKQPGLKARAWRGYLALEPARLLTAVASAPVPDLPPEGGSHEREGGSHEPAVSVAGGAATLPELSELPRLRRTFKVSDDVIRKVLELAHNAGAVRQPGSASAGWAAYRRGDVEVAARELSAAIAGGDARPWVQYALGFATLAQRDAKAAARAWEHVRTAVPQFQETYFDLADAYLQLQDASAAIAVLREAQTRWPLDPDVYNALGVVQIGRGALDDAVKTFEKAVKAAPDDALAYFNLGRAYSMRYFKSQRYSRTTGTWFSNTRDRDLAAAQFEKYLAVGGPYAQQAHEALAALAWK